MSGGFLSPGSQLLRMKVRRVKWNNTDIKKYERVSKHQQILHPFIPSYFTLCIHKKQGDTLTLWSFFFFNKGKTNQERNKVMFPSKNTPCISSLKQAVSELHTQWKLPELEERLLKVCATESHVTREHIMYPFKECSYQSFVHNLCFGTDFSLASSREQNIKKRAGGSVETESWHYSNLYHLCLPICPRSTRTGVYMSEHDDSVSSLGN